MLLFAGENPGMRLYDADGVLETVAFWWRCLWSPKGSGSSVIIWSRDAATSGVWATDPQFASWLNTTFTVHFPEFADIDLDELTIHQADIDGTLDGDGATVTWSASGAAGELTWDDVLARRPTEVSEFASTGMTLRNVYAPTAVAKLRVDGHVVGGAPQVDRRPEHPVSTAFIAFCETWHTP